MSVFVATSTIFSPGAVNIPLGQLESALALGPLKKYQLPDYSDDGRSFIFFCKAGVRAAQAVGIARKLGFTK